MAKSIGVCAFFRKDQLAGGVYSFCENILRGMVSVRHSRDDGDPFELTVFRSPTPLPWQDARVRFHPVSNRLSRFTATAWVGAIASAGLGAVLFPNYFTPPIVRAGRSVTVIHDVQFRHMPQYFSPIKRRWLQQCCAWTLRRCDTVVTISEASRQDILSAFGRQFEAKVRTIHIPVSLDRFHGVPERSFTSGRPYILCAAVDRPQKNLHVLIRAFDRIKDRFPDHLLVMAGQLRRQRADRREKRASIARAHPPAEDLVKQLGLEDRVRVTGFVSDAELGALYRGASIFVLPSLFEGFGMPAVEALAVGTPTLVSGLPVLREVTFGAAQYIDDPTSDSEIAERIVSMLGNVDAARPSEELRNKFRAHFAPQRIAAQFLEVLLA